MERVPNARYTKEFREEAVKRVTESGMSALEVSRRDLVKNALDFLVRQMVSNLFRGSKILGAV